MDFEV